MTLVVALDSLHGNFEMIIALFFYFSDKNLKGIQQIVISTKAANLIKHVVGAIINLTMIAKKKQLERNHSRPNEECFNYRKKNYYMKDCHSSTSNNRKWWKN